MSNNLYNSGFDKWLRKGDPLTQAVDLSADTSVGGTVLGGAGTNNPINSGVSSSNILSGELGSLLGYNKKTFTDGLEGILFGLDIDGVYKWFIGDASNSADWSVSTANTLTIKGTIIATNATTDEKVVISSGSITGYATDGVSLLWRFLQEPTYNNIMTIWKRDFSSSYGNALSIFEYSTDVNDTFNITTDSGAGTGNSGKCLMNLFSSCESLYNNLQIVSTLTDQSNLIYAVKNSGDLTSAMLYLQNKVSDGEGIRIAQEGTTNPNTALLIENKGVAYAVEVYSDNCADEREYAMIKWDVQANTNTGRWGLERVDHCNNKFCMKLGAYYIWVDSAGDIRINLGRPTADNDGVKIADQ